MKPKKEKDSKEKDKKVIELPAYLQVSVNGAQKIYTVAGFIDPDTDGLFRKGRGYINPDDNHIWVFNGSEAPKNSLYPYFWYDGHYILYGKMRDEIEPQFRPDRLRPYSVTEIAKLIDPNKPLYDEAALTDMNSAQSMFVPVIEDKDDFLKKIVKETIIRKQINTAKLKSRLDMTYSFSNLKTALTNSTKMSVVNFLIWMNLLGCKFKILVTDNGMDPVNKINGILEYDHATDSYRTYKTMNHFLMQNEDFQVFYPDNSGIKEAISKVS